MGTVTAEQARTPEQLIRALRAAWRERRDALHARRNANRVARRRTKKLLENESRRRNR